MLHTKYQDAMPYGLRREDFFMFLLCKPMYSMRAIFVPDALFKHI